MRNLSHEKEILGPVLLVALSQGYGGADVRVFDLAKAFHGRISYAVAVLQNSPLHQKLAQANLQVRPFPYSRSDPRLFLQIRKLIKEEGYQVVDAHNPQSQFWGLLAAKATQTPSLVSTVHHAYGRVDDLRWLDRMYEKVLLANIRWGCQFITVSQTIFDYLQDIGVPDANRTLIPNAIDLGDLAQTEPNTTLRAELGWGEDTAVIIIVGRLESVKGHRYLLQALHQAIQEKPQLRCLVVGDGRLRPEIETQITELGLTKVVHLAGFRKDVTALLANSDIFCMASLSEGLPYALLEASAFKLPFVVTNVGGMAELLTDQENALLVPPQNADALAQAFCQLVDHPKEQTKLGQAAHALVKSRFQPEKMVTETFEIYRK